MTTHGSFFSFRASAELDTPDICAVWLCLSRTCLMLMRNAHNIQVRVFLGSIPGNAKDLKGISKSLFFSASSTTR